MSQILKDTFSGLFKVGSLFAKKKLLVKEIGARFASKSELSSIFSGKNEGLLIDGNSSRLSTKDSFEHVAVIAKPGSGKTTAYIIPNIFELAKSGCSIIVNDPSKEVFHLTSGYLQEQGYRILRLSPDEMAASSRFNPFAGLDARNTIEIEQVCAAIIMSKYSTDKEQLWNDGAISIMEILAKCLAYGQPDKLNLIELNRLIQCFETNAEELNDWVAHNCQNPYYPEDDSLLNSWLGLITSQEKMLSSYTTICKTALKQLSNPEIQQLLGSDTLELNKIRHKKTIIYLNFPESQQAYYQFIIDVFYARLFAEVMKARPSKKDLDLFCFLDEFGNSYIHNFSVIINNVRKYRVSLSLVFQGIAQLADKYGPDKARAIKAGIGSSLVFKGGDLDTNQEFAQIIGKRMIVQRESFTAVTQQYNELDLLAPAQLRTMGENQAVFIARHYPPVILECVNFFNHSRFRRLAQKLPAQCSGKSVKLNFDSQLRI